MESGGDAKKIAEALNLMKGVANVTLKEQAVSKWDKAIAEGAITIDGFGARFKEEIHKAYRQ